MDDTLFWGLLPKAFILDLHIEKGFWFENHWWFLIFVEDSCAFYILLVLDFQFYSSDQVFYLCYSCLFIPLLERNLPRLVFQKHCLGFKGPGTVLFFFFTSSGFKITSGQRTLSGQKGDLIDKNLTSITSYWDGHVVYCCLFLNKQSNPQL